MARSLVRSAALCALLVAGCTGSSPWHPVKVYKSDGSLQCQGDGTSVEEMQRELTDRGIAVACGQKASDGSAHVTVCGASTGSINVYTIDAEDLAQAQSLGFASTAELPDYQDQECVSQP